MEVIRAECFRCEVPAPIQAKLQDGVSEVGLTIKKLFATRYQVLYPRRRSLAYAILWHNSPRGRCGLFTPPHCSRDQVLPFIYTHLVSALSTFYLMVTAFLIGLYFQPGEPVVFTMCLSIIGLFVAILSTFGLLEVGSTILDPFGEDPEDFALTHFVEYSMGVSREAIEIRPCTVRGAHADFYSPDEIASAFKIFKTLIRKFRWKKIIQEARRLRIQAEAEERERSEAEERERSEAEERERSDAGERERSDPEERELRIEAPDDAGPAHPGETLTPSRKPPRQRQKPRSARRDSRDGAGRRVSREGLAPYPVTATRSAPNLSC